VTSGTLMGAPALFSLDPISDAGTLDELVRERWEMLTAHRAVACPICAQEMSPDYGQHARPIGGSCSRCGATLR
jgi:hypothetical protein